MRAGIGAIRERLEKSFDEHEFVGGATSHAIAEAERAFPRPFPSDFREFLRQLGSGHVESEEFLGLGEAPHLDVVSAARRLRAASFHATFPEWLVPVRRDGFGNYDCIDLRESDPFRSRMVFWEHAGDPADLVVLEGGYWEWFEGILEAMVAAREPEGRRTRKAQARLER